MILNKTISENKISIYDAILSFSIVSNFCCILYIQKQNEQINELAEKNKELVNSINKLNTDIAKIGNDIVLMNSKTLNPIMISTSGPDFYTKALIITGLIVTGVATTYYFSSFVVTKISSLSLSNLFTLPKIVSVNSILTNLPFNLPFLDQKKQISMILQDLPVTIFIQFLNGEVSSISFRHISDENSTPIFKAIEAYLKLQNNEVVVSETTKVVSPEELASVVVNATSTLDALTSLI